MAFKTIEIDLEAYELLRALRAPGESFSQVIKRRLRRVGTGRDLAAALDRVEAAESTLARTERIVRDRRRSPARRPKP